MNKFEFSSVTLGTFPWLFYFTVNPCKKWRFVLLPEIYFNAAWLLNMVHLEYGWLSINLWISKLLPLRRSHPHYAWHCHLTFTLTFTRILWSIRLQPTCSQMHLCNKYIKPLNKTWFNVLSSLFWCLRFVYLVWYLCMQLFNLFYYK